MADFIFLFVVHASSFLNVAYFRFLPRARLEIKKLTKRSFLCEIDYVF